jgi:hypothetical protein
MPKPSALPHRDRVMATNTHATARPSLTVSAEALVNGVLYGAILISFLVIIEPAPYEGLLALLALALVLAGARVDRLLAPMILLIAIWAVFGAFALMPVIENTQSLTYYLVSVYLAVSALIFACLFAEHTERRLLTLQRSYIVAGLIAAILGIIGYFDVIPGLRGLLVENDRAKATFKDPNVFGPYLILPLLFLVQEFLYRGFRLRHIVTGLVILMALFLSFSRGAWGHAVGSALFMVVMMFFTSPSPRFRRRLVMLTLAAAGGIAAMLMILLSFGSVKDMFAQRANLINYYDTDAPSGRFGRQLEGFLHMFDYPNGVGPKYFAVVFGQDPHNVYLATLYAHGWIGGFAYSALVVTTLVVGFKGLLVRAPWQPALIAVYATYLGVALEGFIIDTDHWRHYFLLLGAVWGLAIASLRYRPVPPKVPRRLEDRARIAQP